MYLTITGVKKTARCIPRTSLYGGSLYRGSTSNRDNFCSLLYYSGLLDSFFHKNYLPGTPYFTGSKHRASFNFS